MKLPQTKWVRRIFLIGAILGILLIIPFRWILDPVFGPLYDLFSQQRKIETIKQVQEGLRSFPTVSYQELIDSGLAEGDELPSMKLYRNRRFLLIEGSDRYRFLVGKQRVHTFLSSQRLWRIRLPKFGHTQYLLIDVNVLEQLLRLQQTLKKEKLDHEAFVVTSGFRPPTYNKQVGGKSKSRHLHGQAIDIVVQDINNDGENDQMDTDLTYKILDQQIIRHTGGLGRYKSDLQVIHFDCRGHRARWHY